jgi:hypothetical protein
MRNESCCVRTKPTGHRIPNLFPHAIVILGLLVSVPAARTETPIAPPGRYYTSWLGNTYMANNGKKNVTEELNDICVSPNGHVFTAGYAETWGAGPRIKPPTAVLSRDTIGSRRASVTRSHA